MKTSADYSPLAQKITAPGIIEPGKDNQLLQISHSDQQIGVLRMQARGPLAELGKTFTGQRQHTQPCKQAQRLIKRLAPLQRVSQHHPPQTGSSHRGQQDRETKPSLLITEHPLQPDLLTGLVKPQPPAGPDQIQTPPLLLDPLPPGKLRL